MREGVFQKKNIALETENSQTMEKRKLGKGGDRPMTGRAVAAVGMETKKINYVTSHHSVGLQSFRNGDFWTFRKYNFGFVQIRNGNRASVAFKN